MRKPRKLVHRRARTRMPVNAKGHEHIVGPLKLDPAKGNPIFNVHDHLFPKERSTITQPTGGITSTV